MPIRISFISRARAARAILLLAGLCGCFRSFSQTIRLDSADQFNFWANLEGFAPLPAEKEGLEAHFSSSSPDSLYRGLLRHFHQQSFLAASLDTTGENEPLHFHIGPRFRWVSLRAGESIRGKRWISGARFRPAALEGKRWQISEVQALQTALIQQAENNGYPFAAVWLDSLEFQSDGGVAAVMQLDEKRFFSIKSVKITGDVKLPPAFMSHYLGVRAGMPYSRARVLQLREQLRSLLFVEPTANPGVTFAGNPAAATGDAIINLYLNKKRASRFDFILGVLPQPNASDGQLLINGSLSAAFQNALNLGERFSAELERLRPETQKVDVQAGVPYLFGSAFGAEGRLGIFRRDSTWTDAQTELGASYLFRGADFVRFFWENKSSTLQQVDTLQVLATRQLPVNLDFRQNGFGIETAFTRLDYRFNPRKGGAFVLKVAAGFNTIRRNTQIENLRDPEAPDFSFASLYDTVAGRAARYRVEFRGEYFIPVFVRSTFKVGLRGGGIFSEKPVLVNEQYRLGGNKLLRGFDEESLFATRFAMATFEWRLLIGPNSFLAAFADAGYLENLTRQNRLFLRPLGLGAGLNFETRAGIFGISVAVGRRDTGQAVDFRAAKFHLGYVSLF
jgi:hypothetical protein